MAQPRQYKFLINEFRIKKCVLSLTLIFEPRGEGGGGNFHMRSTQGCATN